MSRVRQLYASDLLYVGPTGVRAGITQPGTGALSSSGALSWGNILAGTSGVNYIAELFRVQRVDDSWSRNLTNINQIGNLAAIDRITLEQPTVNLSANWITANFINESLIGLTVSKPGSPSQVSAISGLLTSATEPLNYFIKTVDEGHDAANYNPSSYDVISFGNCYIDSFTAQGSVGNFPTTDVTLRALNVQAQTVNQAVGAVTPAVIQESGIGITGWGYVLPTGTSSFNNLGINSTTQALSALRPGDIQFNLGLGVGDGFVSQSDLKIQSYNISFNLNRENLLKLGSKYAFAIVPRYPIDVSLRINALVGDYQTGSLIEIVNNNTNFNPSISINAPGTSNIVAYYQLRGAKLQDNNFSQSVGSTAKTVDMTFVTQIAGPEDLVNGLFLSGVTVT